MTTETELEKATRMESSNMITNIVISAALLACVAFDWMTVASYWLVAMGWIWLFAFGLMVMIQIGAPSTNIFQKATAPYLSLTFAASSLLLILVDIMLYLRIDTFNSINSMLIAGWLTFVSGVFVVKVYNSLT